MTNSMQNYLETLKNELKGSDLATIQDALVDAEEHLTSALEALREERPEMDENKALEQVIEQYGSPKETANAYMEVERLTTPGLAPAARKKDGSVLGHFFGIYTDPRAWGSLFYMLIAFVTGVAYFSWAVTGISVSISFALFIFGLPVAFLFLLSVRGLALLEGRLVEALLGVRMPRRSLLPPKGGKLLERIKLLLLDKHTWFSILYMFLQFVLGTVYFVVLVTILALSLSGLAIPVSQEVFHEPMIQNYEARYFLPQWGYPLVVFAGILLWTGTMHLVKWVGSLHGRYAKALLVSE